MRIGDVRAVGVGSKGARRARQLAPGMAWLYDNDLYTCRSIPYASFHAWGWQHFADLAGGAVLETRREGGNRIRSQSRDKGKSLRVIRAPLIRGPFDEAEQYRNQDQDCSNDGTEHETFNRCVRQRTVCRADNTMGCRHGLTLPRNMDGAKHLPPVAAPRSGARGGGGQGARRGGTADNILCLCPNHHVQFDKGGFTINNDLTLNELDGRLTVHRDHTVNLDHIQHHRMRFAR